MYVRTNKHANAQARSNTNVDSRGRDEQTHRKQPRALLAAICQLQVACIVVELFCVHVHASIHENAAFPVHIPLIRQGIPPP
jgi:hypothetical protein